MNKFDGYVSGCMTDTFLLTSYATSVIFTMGHGWMCGRKQGAPLIQWNLGFASMGTKDGREEGRAAGDSIAEGKNNYPASFNKLHN